MNAPFTSHAKPNIEALLGAVSSHPNDQTLNHLLSPAQWAVLGVYLQTSTLAPGQILISQGAADRSLYFVESGMLTVHFEDAGGRIHLAAVGAGSVVNRSLPPHVVAFGNPARVRRSV